MLEILDKSRSIKNAYISRISSALENTYGIFTLYLVMKKRKAFRIRIAIYICTGIMRYGMTNSNIPGRTTNCMISMQASSEDSQYAGIVSILTPMYMNELSNGKIRLPNGGGESYRKFKRKSTADTPLYSGAWH